METNALSKLPARALIFSLLLVLLVLFFSKSLNDPDFWFHMTVGREAILSGHVPDKTFYISGLIGNPEKFYEWGFGTLLYLTHSAFGAKGLSVLNTVLATLAILLLVLQAWTAAGKWVVPAAVIATLIVAAGMDVRITLRPENVLFVAVAATIALLEIRNRTTQDKWLYPIPLIGLVMSNLHPSAIIVVGTIGCYLAQDIFKGRSWGAARALTLTAFATSIAAMLTPFGPEQLFLPFIFAADAGLTGQVVEFFPIMTTSSAPLFLAIFLAGLAAFAVKPRSPNAIARGLLFLTFTVLTLRYSRNLGLFAIASFNPLCHLIDTALTKAESRLSKKMAIGIACLLLAALVTALGWYRYTRNNFGYGFRDGVFPSYALQLKDRDEVTAIASLFHFGGYLAWTTHKPVLVDGRNYSFNSVMQDHNQIFSRQPQWESLLAKHHIDTIFTPTLQPFKGTPVPLLGELYFSPNWKLCAMDEIGLWFARSDKVTGAGMDKDLIWKRMNFELQRKRAPLKSTDPVLKLSLDKAQIADALPWPQTSEFCWSH